MKPSLKVNILIGALISFCNAILMFQGIGCSSSFEDLTPNLDVSDSAEEEDIIPKLKCTQNNETSNVEELLALCSGKFPGKLCRRFVFSLYA